MKDDMSDFIKMAYKNGDIKDVSLAFEEFPPEEEWHKGSIDYFINESSLAYGDICEIGDIVFVKKYRYSDGQTGQNHLFVIIDQNNIAVPIENFGMIISSNLDKLKYRSNILLEKNNINNLNKNSLVKTDEIYKIANEQIAFKIGKVELDKVNEYKKCYMEKNK